VRKPVILATPEMEIRRIMVQGQLGQKVHKAPSQPIKAGCGGMCTCHPGQTGSINRKITVQAFLGIKVRPYLKNNQRKKG
jgi:hypothetical protein